MNYTRSIFAALLISATSISTVFCGDKDNRGYIKRGTDIVAHVNNKIISVLPTKVQNLLTSEPQAEDSQEQQSTQKAIFSKGFVIGATVATVVCKYGKTIAEKTYLNSAANAGCGVLKTMVTAIKSLKK